MTDTTHAQGCWSWGPRHYECAVREIKALRADLKESEEIREKLGHLLTRTAKALKGEPPEGTWHSWHDLPETAAQLVERVQRDEARVMVDRLTAELAKCAAVLPVAYYMYPPDGGDVPVSEQLRRMAKDAERYRYLRRKVAIAGAQFLVMNLPSPVYVAPDAAAEFDSALDAERSARDGDEAANACLMTPNA